MNYYSVAVRPTAEEIAAKNLYYDEQYYEDRAQKIEAFSESDAIAKYIKDDQATEDRPDIGLKKGDHFFLRREEIPYVRAKKI